MKHKTELYENFRVNDFEPEEILLINSSLIATKALFDLTEQQKSAVKMKPLYNRGWDKTQPLSIEKNKAYRESFVFGLDRETSDLKNIWPKELEKHHIDTLMSVLSFSINRCIDWYRENAKILELKLRLDAFTHNIYKSDLRIKLAAYFPNKEIAFPQTGCFEHEDFGFLTMNFSNKSTDLYVYLKGKWIRSKKATIASLWSGDQISQYSATFTPTRHKVILNDNNTRYSLSLFIEI
jgi:isopenicillin N synthase-like dioxygenase